uniref:Transmembrane protein 218 n=1 Tax=Anser brachyrhynchus TaxID=132585 RepID=A0A8B9IB29_9AVES
MLRVTLITGKQYAGPGIRQSCTPAVPGVPGFPRVGVSCLVQGFGCKAKTRPHAKTATRMTCHPGNSSISATSASFLTQIHTQHRCSPFPCSVFQGSPTLPRAGSEAKPRRVKPGEKKSHCRAAASPPGAVNPSPALSPASGPTSEAGWARSPPQPPGLGQRHPAAARPRPRGKTPAAPRRAANGKRRQSGGRCRLAERRAVARQKWRRGSMAGPVLGAGPGALLLAALWALALLLCLALARAPGAARLAALPVPVVAALLSAALLLYPREEEEEGAGPPPGTEIVDTFFIGRLILLAVMALVFLGCLFFLLLHHLAEPVYAKPLRSSWRVGQQQVRVAASCGTQH